VGQLAPLVEREVEQGRQGHGGQFLGDQVHPVEGLADRQGVEDLAGALAHHRRHQGDVGRRQRRADRLALGAVVRLVQADERGFAAPRGLDLLLLGALARQPQALGRHLQVCKHDPAGGGEGAVVGVHRHDVVPPGDRPIGTKFALGREVDGVLGAQALEDGPDGAGLEAVRIARIELLKRQGGGLGCGGLRGVDFHGDVHGFTPFRPAPTPCSSAVAKFSRASILLSRDRRGDVSQCSMT
jgi:hypothetical protein